MTHQLAPDVKEALLGRWEPIYRSQLHYLVTWSTRGRRAVLKERHIESVQKLVAQVCEERGYTLLEFAAGADHTHLLFALRPAQSVASAVREIKGRSSVTLLSQHPELRVWLRGNLVWDERYAAETVSPARLTRVRERLRAVHRDSEESGPPDALAAAS